MKERKLHVISHSGYKYKGVPAIILKGKWLSDYDFKAGDKITVSGKEKILVIESHD